MSSHLLKLSNISKRFALKCEDEPLFSNISLEVACGESVGIFGPSGSGKTTLGRILKGYSVATSGDVFFDGHQTNAKNLLKNPDIQLVFQNPYESLSPKMTVKQMLLEPLKYDSRWVKSDHSKIVHDLCIEFKVKATLLQQFPYQLSGGERQRIALLRALLVEPKVLICDEILSSLDHPLQEQIMALLLRYQKKHKTSIILIAHDLILIQRFCKKVLLLNQGVGTVFDPTDLILNSQDSFVRNSIEALEWLTLK